MRVTPVLLLGMALAVGCARNQDDAAGAPEQESGRIRDTTLTAKDTLAPADTLPRVRDSVPDSTSGA